MWSSTRPPRANGGRRPRRCCNTIAQQDNTISEIRSSQKRPHTEIAFYTEQQENGGPTVAAATMQAKSTQNSLGSISILLVRLNFGQERQPVHLLVVGKAWETSHEPLATWRRSFPLAIHGWQRPALVRRVGDDACRSAGATPDATPRCLCWLHGSSTGASSAKTS